MPRPTEETEGRGGRRVRKGDKEIERGCNTEKGGDDGNMGKGTDKKERSKEGVREGKRKLISAVNVE